MTADSAVPPPTDSERKQRAAQIRALYPTPEAAPSRIMLCLRCGAQRWAGYGPCSACNEPSPWSSVFGEGSQP